MRIIALVFASLLAASAHAQSLSSGSWYNPAQSGHGLAIDQLSPDAALMLWFTYDAVGNPMPLYAEGRRDGAAFTGPAYAPSGPRFNDFDPAELDFTPWGTLSFTPHTCGAATLAWDAPAFGAGTTPLQPLTALCAPNRAPLAGLSGTWSHPQLQGASFNVQVLGADSALVYWYTYDSDGRPLPLYIEARIEGQTLSGRALSPRGMRFGRFSRTDLSVEDFGRVEIDFHDCDSATLRWDTPLGRGEQPVSRLTRLQGSQCDLPKAAPAGLAVAYTGTATQDTWLRTRLSTTMLTGANGDLVMIGAGWHRGRFHRENGKLYLHFNGGYRGEVEIDRNTGVLRAYLDSPTQIPVWLELVPERAGGSRLTPVGGYGAWVAVSPGVTTRELVIEPDGQFVLARLGRGRISNYDPATGRFSFDFRYDAELGGYDDDIVNTRVIGLGRLESGPFATVLRLMGTQVAGFTGVSKTFIQ